MFRRFFILISLYLFSISNSFAAMVTYNQIVEANPSSGGTISGVAFNDDGTKMFTTGSKGSDDEINEWDLTTAFDVSTASHVDRLPVGTGELGIDLVWDNEPFGLTFNDNFKK